MTNAVLDAINIVTQISRAVDQFGRSVPSNQRTWGQVADGFGGGRHHSADFLQERRQSEQLLTSLTNTINQGLTRGPLNEQSAISLVNQSRVLKDEAEIHRELFGSDGREYRRALSAVERVEDNPTIRSLVTSGDRIGNATAASLPSPGYQGYQSIAAGQVPGVQVMGTTSASYNATTGTITQSQWEANPAYAVSMAAQIQPSPATPAISSSSVVSAPPAPGGSSTASTPATAASGGFPGLSAATGSDAPATPASEAAPITPSPTTNATTEQVKAALTEAIEATKGKNIMVKLNGVEVPIEAVIAHKGLSLLSDVPEYVELAKKAAPLASSAPLAAIKPENFDTVLPGLQALTRAAREGDPSKITGLGQVFIKGGLSGITNDSIAAFMLLTTPTTGPATLTSRPDPRVQVTLQS